jgi:hypothetical protein
MNYICQTTNSVEFNREGEFSKGTFNEILTLVINKSAATVSRKIGGKKLETKFQIRYVDDFPKWSSDHGKFISISGFLTREVDSCREYFLLDLQSTKLTKTVMCPPAGATVSLYSCLSK